MISLVYKYRICIFFLVTRFIKNIMSFREYTQQHIDDQTIVDNTPSDGSDKELILFFCVLYKNILD